MSSQRILKVNELVKREIGKIMREEVDDPCLDFVTIVDVNTSPDLKNTSIYLSYIGKKQQGEKIKRILHKALFEIQKRLNRTLKMRNVPRVAFDFDYSARQAQKIERLVKESKE